MANLIDNKIKTRRLLASCKNDLAKAALILKKGNIVALPTETVYGLAAHGFLNSAIEKVFTAKNRPLTNPLILHVNNSKKAFKLFDFSFNEKAHQRFELLAKAFWPGPLTIVAKKAKTLSGMAFDGLTSVAVRVPRNKVTLAIIDLCDFPLVMPSANLSTRPSPTCAEHVFKTLDGRIDAVMDDGPCEVGIESTVIAIDLAKATILRPGMIDVRALENCLGEEVVFAPPLQGEKPLSPGQLFLHYAPTVASIELINKEDISVYWQSDSIILGKKSDFDGVLNSLCDRPENAVTIALDNDPKLYAKNLYDALYICENTPEKRLLIVAPLKDSLEWHAIFDRLKRSAG